MLDRIIFCFGFPFTKRHFAAFKMQELADAGIVVEVWNISSCISPQLADNNDIYWECAMLKTIKKRQELTQKILQLNESSLFVFCINYCAKSLFVFRAVSKKKIKSLLFHHNITPIVESDTGLNIRASFFKKLRHLTFTRVMNKVITLLPRKFLGISDLSFVVTGGAMSQKVSSFPVGKATKFWSIHSTDYDSYIEIIEKDKACTDKHVVFLDEFGPFHPDFIYAELNPFTTQGSYYPALCSFFSIVEDFLNSKVTIAAHPRVNYQNYGAFFGERSTVQNRTAELVANSKLVLAHSSTSINFAVLFRKPIIFITTNEIEKSKQSEWIKVFAAQFGKTPINIDQLGGMKIDFNVELFVDEEKYSQYIEKYIKGSKSPRGSFSEIFLKYFRIV